MKIKCIAAVIGLIFCFSVSYAQDDSTATGAKRSYVWAGVQYSSDAAYLGRKDSVAIPYITPQLGYFNRAGWYILGSLSYLPRSGDNRIDVFTLTAGYDFSIGDHFSAGGEYSHNFFSNQSYSVLAGMPNAISAYGVYDFRSIGIGAGIDMNFGTQTDVLTNLNISREFKACKNKLHITPAVFVNAGQYNTYETYYTTRRYSASRGNGKSNGRGNGNSGSSTSTTAATTVSIQQVQGFHVLDYEIKAPVEYETNRFKLTFTPVYMIPVNPAQIDMGGTTQTESLHPVFVAEIKAGIKFSNFSHRKQRKPKK